MALSNVETGMKNTNVLDQFMRSLDRGVEDEFEEFEIPCPQAPRERNQAPGKRKRPAPKQKESARG